MIYSRIGPETLRDRLDASYYSPDVLANEAALLARGALTLRHLIDVDRSNYGVLPPSEDYLPLGTGVPLIRGGDLEHGGIRTPEVHAPLEFRNERGTAVEGDVLLLIKGACIDNPAGVALVTANDAGSVFNGSCYRIRPLAACDAGYLVAYCQTKYLLLQKRREIANTGISYNAESSVLGYLVPNIRFEAQRYIGSQVRRAGLLRERARRRKTKALAAVLALFFNVNDFTKSSSCSFRTSAKVLEHRLDTRFYAPISVALEEVLREPGLAGERLEALVHLDREITNGVRGPELVDSRFKLVRLQDARDWAVEFADCATISENQYRQNGRCKLHPGDVVVAIGGYIGNAAIVLDETEAVIGQHSAVLPVDAAKIDPFFLTTYLNSQPSVRHMDRYVSGTVQAGINLEDLRRVRVPVPAGKLQANVGRDAKAAILAFRFSAYLTIAARSLVEQLIEGAVSEDDLVVAQKALEAGDRGADRTILKSIRRGDAAAAPALFSDLEALYALLDDEDDAPRAGS